MSTENCVSIMLPMQFQEQVSFFEISLCRQMLSFFLQYAADGMSMRIPGGSFPPHMIPHGTILAMECSYFEVINFVLAYHQGSVKWYEW